MVVSYRSNHLGTVPQTHSITCTCRARRMMTMRKPMAMFHQGSEESASSAVVAQKANGIN